VSDSLRPRPQNIAAMLGVALPVLAMIGSIIMAYADMATDRATRALLDGQHEAAITRLREDVDKVLTDKETARELSALRAQVASLTATVEALRDDVKRRR
jgi:hypothetical protein